MKVLSCYIENFGKFSEFTYDFKDGLNIIEEDNGWGKTTLAAFIKAMFFGLEYHRGHKLTDRKLYKPWNGNKFGGYMIFERDGREYKVERFFGRTEKFDTVKVYDMVRNTETDELGDSPGETIWGVDRDSYEKTAFITLDGSSLLNDIISSKLGNIEDQESDLDESSQAVELLDSKMRELKARRGNNALIGKKKGYIEELKAELKDYKNSLVTIENIKEWIEDEEVKLLEKNREINKIEEEQSKLVLYEKKRQYESIKEDFNRRKKEYELVKEFFDGEELSKEELDSIKEEEARYVNNREQARKIKLGDRKKEELEKLEEKFSNQETDSKEIERYNRKINKLSNMETELNEYTLGSRDRLRLDELEGKYKATGASSATIDGYLEDFNKVSGLVGEENNIANRIERLEESSGKVSGEKKKPSLLIGLALVIAGLILAPMVLWLGIALALLGAGLLVKNFIDKLKTEEKDTGESSKEEVKSLKEKLEELREIEEKLESGYLSFINSVGGNPDNIASLLAASKADIMELERLRDVFVSKSKLREGLEGEISALRTDIENYLGKYYDSLEESYYGSLSKLREDLNRFQKLKEVEDSYKELVDRVEESKSKLEQRLSHYYGRSPMDISESVKKLSQKYYELENSEARYDEERRKKLSFESENDIAALTTIDLNGKYSGQEAEFLKDRKENSNREAEGFIKTIERYKKDLNKHIQKANKIEDTESEIGQAGKDLEDLRKKHWLLSLAKESMVEAKENLAEKYMGDVSSNFKKYLDKLNNNQSEQYDLDINLDIKVQHGGEFYDKNQLSSGMKDLVQLCLRMALVESVYKGVDNPILVLDDPFINLDNSRLENAIDLLREISLDYQVVYFICHSSRSIEVAS